MDRSSEFNLLLKLHLEGNAKHSVKPATTLYPIATEQYYYSKIKELQTAFITTASVKLKDRLKFWFDKNKKDEYSDDYEAFMREMEDELIALYGVGFLWGTDIANIINSVSQRIFSFGNEQWSKQLEKVLGMKWKAMAEWWPELQKRWAINNYTLIKDLSKDYTSKLNTLLIVAMQSYWGFSELGEAIDKLNIRFINNRSKLLARDQVGILNSLIWQEQFKEIGLKEYIWHTAMDERVRGNPMGKYPKAIPSHYVMHGLVCTWEDSSIISKDNGKTWIKKIGIMEPLHPGQAIACRCVPLPFWGNKVNSILGGK